MIKYIDEVEERSVITGFGYHNKNREPETVEICQESLITIYASNEEVTIYTDDIPKLIKALQAAYKHQKEQS